MWQVRSNSDEGLTQFNAVNDLIQPSGASSRLKPLSIGNEVLYFSTQDNSVRALSPTTNLSYYVSLDRSPFSRHLFDESPPIAWAYAAKSDRVLWVVREDGVLLGCSYAPSQDVAAWSRHETQHGAFKDIAVVTERELDRVYVATKRTGLTSGAPEQFVIERMGAKDDDLHRNAIFDCAHTLVEKSKDLDLALSGGRQNSGTREVESPDGTRRSVDWSSIRFLRPGEFESNESFWLDYAGETRYAETTTATLDIFGTDVPEGHVGRVYYALGVKDFNPFLARLPQMHYVDSLGEFVLGKSPEIFEGLTNRSAPGWETGYSD